MRRFGRLGFHVPPVAIADYVAKHGAVSLAEILFKFDIGETTLRRHRPALRQLGLEFVENGRWSYYARADLLTRSPTSSRPLAYQEAANAPAKAAAPWVVRGSKMGRSAHGRQTVAPR